MKKQWIAFKARYWAARTGQERKLLLVTLSFGLPVLFYFLLWQPAHTAVEKLQKSLPKLRVQAVRLQQQTHEIETLRHQAQQATLSAGNLKAAIEASAERQLLRNSITSINLQDEHTVRLTFDSVPFSSWLRWLHALQQEQHIRAESVSITALPQPGQVTISLSLTSGALQQ